MTAISAGLLPLFVCSAISRTAKCLWRRHRLCCRFRGRTTSRNALALDSDGQTRGARSCRASRACLCAGDRPCVCRSDIGSSCGCLFPVHLAKCLAVLGVLSFSMSWSKFVCCAFMFRSKFSAIFGLLDRMSSIAVEDCSRATRRNAERVALVRRKQCAACATFACSCASASRSCDLTSNSCASALRVNLLALLFQELHVPIDLLLLLGQLFLLTSESGALEIDRTQSGEHCARAENRANRTEGATKRAPVVKHPPMRE